MSHKTYLVARREYIENIRTKTFWIGILLFPVIWGVMLFLPAWLQKKKSLRRYAVLDHSGFVLGELEARLERPDLIRVLEAVRAAKDDAERQRFPEAVRTGALAKMAAALDDPKARKGIEELQRHLPLLEAQGAAAIRQGFELYGDLIRAMRPELREVDAEQAVAVLEAQLADLDALRQWWRGLPPEEAKKYARTDTKAEAGLGRYERVAAEGDEKALDERLQRGDLFAYFVVPKDPVGKPPAKEAAGAKASDTDRFVYQTKQENLADDELKKWLGDQLTSIVQEKRLSMLPIGKSQADWLAARVWFNEQYVSASGKVEQVKTADKLLQWAPMVFVYMLWILIFSIAQLLLTNTIEEKSNRLIEVLLSSVSPSELMIGKTFGLAATGLTMLLSWVVFAILGLELAPLISESSAASIAEWGLGRILANPRYAISFLVYFLLGYLLYASLLVGIGSVCNSLKEAQNLMQPVILLLIVPLVAMFPITQDPNGALAKVLSYIPIFTPFVMMNRAGGPPSVAEYAITTVLLVLTVLGALYLAAKIFRVGILMTGKPPKLREILSWLRAPVGSMPTQKE